MKNENYNGWTNYVTWRVNLEMFDGNNPYFPHGRDWDGNIDAMKEFVVLEIEESTSEGLGRDYALAFIEDVNWNEIAEHYQEEANQ